MRFSFKPTKMCVKVKNMLKIYSPLQDNKNCVKHLVSKIHFMFLKMEDEMKKHLSPT